VLCNLPGLHWECDGCSQSEARLLESDCHFRIPSVIIIEYLSSRAMVLFVSDPFNYENRIYPKWRHLGGISLINFSDGKLLFVLSSSATIVSDVPRHLLDVYRLVYNRFCKLQIYKLLWMLRNYF
jgi:hypothetical protein